jgi:hypothetical protein
VDSEVDSEYSFVLRISISEFLLGFNMKYEVRRKRMAKKNVMVVGVLAIAAIMIVVVFAAITSTKTVPSSGTIAGVNLGVYSDPGCTIALDASNPIVWGTVNPGAFVTQTVYILNTGTTDMTLALTTSNWVNQSLLTLTWDKESAVVNPGLANKVTAILTLTASSSFTTGTDFSVDIVITGTHT